MSVNSILIKEQVHQHSGLSQSLYNIEQSLRLATDQEKAILSELKDKLKALSTATDTEIEKYIAELKKTSAPAEDISNVSGNTGVQWESAQMKLISSQYPILNAVFGAIQNRMSQSSILSGGSIAAPKRRAPARRRTTTSAPKRRKKRATTTISRRR